MLGDAGANALGALLGVALAARTGTAGRALALAVLAGAHRGQREGQLHQGHPGHAVAARGWTSWAVAGRDPGACRTECRDRTDRRCRRGHHVLTVVSPDRRLRPHLRLPAHRRRRTDLANIYNAANTIPNIVFELVAGGALASLVVPLLAGRGGGRRPAAGRRRHLGAAHLGARPAGPAGGAGRAGRRADRPRCCRGVPRRAPRRWPRACCGCSRRSCRCTGSASC